jgi:hypothetical protein
MALSATSLHFYAHPQHVVPMRRSRAGSSRWPPSRPYFHHERILMQPLAGCVAAQLTEKEFYEGRAKPCNPASPRPDTISPCPSWGACYRELRRIPLPKLFDKSLKAFRS